MVMGSGGRGVEVVVHRELGGQVGCGVGTCGGMLGVSYLHPISLLYCNKINKFKIL